MNAPISPAAFYALSPVEKIQTGDAVLALRRYGAGPPLLLVHGFPLHGFTWRKLLPELSRHHTCLVVDLAGKGDSEWTPQTDFTWSAHARRLKKLVDHLGLESYSALAQDTGGTIARCLGFIDAGRMAKLAIINSEIPGHRPPWIPLYQKLLRLPGSTFVLLGQMRMRWWLRSGMGFGGCFSNLDLIDGEFHDHFIAPYIRSRRSADGLVRYLVGLTWDVVDSLARRHAELRMPVLLVWGQDDPTFPIALAREMAKQFPNSRGLVAIPHTKLLPHEEKPDEVTHAVLEFLAN